VSYIQNTGADVAQMLQTIGVESLESLFSSIPGLIRLKHPLDLPPALSEHELYNILSELSKKDLDTDKWDCFLGGGIYDHFIPAVVDQLSSRSEFYTSYTPYQPEASQGNLQIIYEYQTMMCRLTEMEVSNASHYDGATALSEAIAMSLAATGRDLVILPNNVHPEYRKVVNTYFRYLPVEIVECTHEDGRLSQQILAGLPLDRAGALVIQNPNFFGCVEELEDLALAAKQKGAMVIVCVDPISLGLLKPPGECGADIVVGEGQALGLQMCFGGPSLGFIATKKELIRRIPGRLVGETTDVEGKRGFVLTLQTREQHIRREKATSNICTNQGWMVIRAAIYLAALGKMGLREVANLCLQKSHYLASRLREGGLVRLRFGSPFFKEFVIQIKAEVPILLQGLLERGIMGGIHLGEFYPELRDCILVAVTEKTSRAQMDRFVQELHTILAGEGR
jgi:glycine dehydrogenase subunit 1